MHFNIIERSAAIYIFAGMYSEPYTLSLIASGTFRICLRNFTLFSDSGEKRYVRKDFGHLPFFLSNFLLKLSWFGDIKYLSPKFISSYSFITNHKNQILKKNL